MNINVSKIEKDIYYDICTDFAEYCTNRLNVYSGIIEFLKTTSIETLLSTPRDIIYQLYAKNCVDNSLNCLQPKSFAKAMVGLCGFECIRIKKQGVSTNYYAFKSEVSR